VITPLTLASLTYGLDYAFRVAGIIVLVAAVVALVFLRDDPGRLILEDTATRARYPAPSRPARRPRSKAGDI
jgi:sugar phosphate permease